MQECGKPNMCASTQMYYRGWVESWEGGGVEFEGGRAILYHVIYE
jgi:hypothetical protein